MTVTFSSSFSACVDGARLRGEARAACLHTDPAPTRHLTRGAVWTTNNDGQQDPCKNLADAGVDVDGDDDDDDNHVQLRNGAAVLRMPEHRHKGRLLLRGARRISSPQRARHAPSGAVAPQQPGILRGAKLGRSITGMYAGGGARDKGKKAEIGHALRGCVGGTSGRATPLGKLFAAQSLANLGKPWLLPADALCVPSCLGCWDALRISFDRRHKLCPADRLNNCYRR